ncbi:MAG TPA: hypothetical protein VGE22_12390 [Solimonas sp.]
MKRLAILALAVVAAAAMAAPAQQPRDPVPLDLECKDGHLVRLLALVPVPGIVSIDIPKDICANKPQPQQAPRERPERPARST